MPTYSCTRTNLYIKVCMVCEVCLFSWMGVRPIYIEFLLLIGKGTNLYIKVCMVCEVCLFSWAGGGLFIVLANTIIMRHVLLLLVSVAHIL